MNPTLELLKQALRALNEIPRKTLRGDYPDSYALAAAISEHIRQLEARR
jgi:hypothetical protein